MRLIEGRRFAIAAGETANPASMNLCAKHVELMIRIRVSRFHSFCFTAPPQSVSFRNPKDSTGAGRRLYFFNTERLCVPSAGILQDHERGSRAFALGAVICQVVICLVICLCLAVTLARTEGLDAASVVALRAQLSAPQRDHSLNHYQKLCSQDDIVYRLQQVEPPPTHQTQSKATTQTMTGSSLSFLSSR